METDRREFHSDEKCGSHFEFQVKILKYSEGQASSGDIACRMLNDGPVLAEEIINEIKGKTIKRNGALKKELDQLQLEQGEILRRQNPAGI